MYWKRSALVTAVLVVVSYILNLLGTLFIRAVGSSFSSMADSLNTSVGGLFVTVYQVTSVMSIAVMFLIIWWFMRYFGTRSEKPKRTWIAQSDELIDVPVVPMSKDRDTQSQEPETQAEMSRSRSNSR